MHRSYVVVAYSADEVKARKRIKACDAKPDEAGAVDTFDAIDTILCKPFAYLRTYVRATFF